MEKKKIKKQKHHFANSTLKNEDGKCKMMINIM